MEGILNEITRSKEQTMERSEKKNGAANEIEETSVRMCTKGQRYVCGEEFLCRMMMYSRRRNGSGCNV